MIRGDAYLVCHRGVAEINPGEACRAPAVQSFSIIGAAVTISGLNAATTLAESRTLWHQPDIRVKELV